MGAEPTDFPCECGDVRMRFRLPRPRGLRWLGPKVAYLCHTCDADRPVIAERLRTSAEWKAQGRGGLLITRPDRQG